ncbi:diacylglycerol kinase family lipid kinase [bacterium]|nr:MAG: diacylglycerol kinase family lipid kinase [bacterium]
MTSRTLNEARFPFVFNPSTYSLMSISFSLPLANMVASSSPKVVEVGKKVKNSARPQVLILANPTAGARGKTAARRRQLDKVRDELEKNGFAVHLGFENESKGILERARNAALAETDIIVAAGGDGTVNAVANGMLLATDGQRPVSKLAVLPMGTGNVFALNMNIPSDIRAASQVIVEGQVRRIDVGYALPLESTRLPKTANLPDTHDLPSPRYFLLMAGVGFDAKVIEDTSLRLKMMLRDFAYAFRSLQNAVVHQGTEVTLTFDDGSSHSNNSWLLMAGNAASYAWAIKFTEHARLDDGKLDVCVFPFENKLTSVQQVMQLLMGQHIERGSASYYQTTGVRIESTPPVPVQLDGDEWGTTPLELKMIPGSLDVLAPPPTDR